MALFLLNLGSIAWSWTKFNTMNRKKWKYMDVVIFCAVSVKFADLDKTESL